MVVCCDHPHRVVPLEAGDHRRAIAAICSAALATMPELVPSDRHATGSVRDLGASGAGNMDFAIVADVRHDRGLAGLRQAPGARRACAATVIRPWIAERAAVQFES